MRQRSEPPIIISNVQALGTLWHFEFFEKINIELVTISLMGIIKQFESNYSRFISTSYISILNAKRVYENPSSEFIELLNIGLNYYFLSEGLFNIGIGEILENRGYDSNYSFRAKNQRLNIPKLDLLLSISNDKVTLHGDGNIDLGGFAKGYLIDKLKYLLVYDLNIKYFLINGGGDITVKSNWNKPIEIVLQNPINVTKYIAKIDLIDVSLCASSPFKRQWKDNATQISYNHIVNTNNREINSSFSICNQAVDADFCATVLMFSDVDNIISNLYQRFNLKYLVMSAKGDVILNNMLVK